MLMQMQEKAEQARQQSKPEMEEADTDASAVDSSADAPPSGTSSGTDGNPSQEPSVAAAAPEGSEDENRKPETDDQGGKHPLRAQPAKMTFGRVERRQLSTRAAVARFPSGRVLSPIDAGRSLGAC